ncbi:hypothetical protein [Arsenicibacter rosenii]|nr:hypothetical protein [Arsenicibacter rosenii]
MIEVIDLFERTPGRWHPDVMKSGHDWETVLVELRQAILHIRTDPFRVTVKVKGDRLAGMKVEVICANLVIRRRVIDKLLPVVTPKQEPRPKPQRDDQLAAYRQDRRVISLTQKIDELDRPDLTSEEQARRAMFIRILNDLKTREYPDL